MNVNMLQQNHMRSFKFSHKQDRTIIQSKNKGIPVHQFLLIRNAHSD